MKKKLLSLTISALLISSILVGCGGTATPPAEEPTAAVESAEESTDEVTLRVAWWGRALELNSRFYFFVFIK